MAQLMEAHIAPNATAETMNTVFQQQLKHQYAMRRTTASERKARLKRLGDCLLKRQKEMEEAMWADFRKSPTEVAISEMGVVMGEIRHTLSHLNSWMTPRKAGTPLALFGSSSEIRYEPKGVCLIISPWNFPFNLTFSPLVSAIAAGNCVVLKPSEYTPHCSALMRSIVEECFPPEEVVLFEGDVEVSKHLLSLPFNHIFFTGSPAVGKIVMAAAAKHLTSVTLELGGKSPVIVDETANLDMAAASLAWLKILNAGQVCIAPDYLLVHESVREALLAKIKIKIMDFYGKDKEARFKSPDLCRLVSSTHFTRVKRLLEDAVEQGATVDFGGYCVAEDRYIEPTILTNIPEDALIWQEEIFGPLLPVRSWTQREEVVEHIRAAPIPLAMYVFSSKNKHIEYFLSEIRSGGVTVNDCAVQFYNQNIPFGGANNSGIGETHGEFGFLAFTQSRSILRQSRIFPSTKLMMPPYGRSLGKLVEKALVRWL